MYIKESQMSPFEHKTGKKKTQSFKINRCLLVSLIKMKIIVLQ